MDLPSSSLPAPTDSQCTFTAGIGLVAEKLQWDALGNLVVPPNMGKNVVPSPYYTWSYTHLIVQKHSP